jgi:hypothetical protein
VTEARGRGWRLILGDCLDVLPTLGTVDHVIVNGGLFCWSRWTWIGGST